MSPWWWSHNSSLPANGRDWTEDDSETTSFLIHTPHQQSSNVAPGYDSVETRDRERGSVTNHELRVTEFSTSTPQQRTTARSSSVLLVAALVGIAALTTGFVFLIQQQQSDASLFSVDLIESKPVYAPQVADSSTSFAELARAMIPSWYNLTLSQLSVFTPTVTPDKVYMARKILLKTRDLLDVFSPAYPNTTTTMDYHGDLWNRIRHYVSVGYECVGVFQDLHNAHVTYAPPGLMEELRAHVLEWNHSFTIFHNLHEPQIQSFLSNPSLDSFLHNESHLFWMNVIDTLPSGRDGATSSLQRLGLVQLQQALGYLANSTTFHDLFNESAHATYHNLRKELRSLTDEFELFKWFMFPSGEGTESAMKIFIRARALLGDINDDWTALSIYAEYNIVPAEQERLRAAINDKWAAFLDWVDDVDFVVVVQNLAKIMKETTQEPELLSRSSRSSEASVSLNEFLHEVKRHATQHFVIGNDAGDADSIVSVITLAYIETLKQDKFETPIVAIPKAELNQRPEVGLLFELAGVSHPTRNLYFIDDPIFHVAATNDASVTLVDHNVLQQDLLEKNWKVLEIVDHHQDEGFYLDTCFGSARSIAFADDQALVASACTLVAERLKQVWWERPYPGSLGLLLLGVILLDSVNLDPHVGKVTQRDLNAVQDLVEHTDWNSLPSKSREALEIRQGLGLDTTLIFDMLQDAKYDDAFWNSLSVRDALRYDYKDYAYSDAGIFGISTVLMSLQDFFENKVSPRNGIFDYMNEIGIDFLGIMFAFEKNGLLCRQLALCGTDAVSMNDVAAYLLQQRKDPDRLDLTELSHPVSNLQEDETTVGLSLRFFDQHNVKPSRKQIGPILLHFFDITSSRFHN